MGMALRRDAVAATESRLESEARRGRIFARNLQLRRNDLSAGLSAVVPSEGGSTSEGGAERRQYRLLSTLRPEPSASFGKNKLQRSAIFIAAPADHTRKLRQERRGRMRWVPARYAAPDGT